MSIPLCLSNNQWVEICVVSCLAIRNKDAVNVYVQLLVWTDVLGCLGYILGSEMARSYGNFLNIWDI